MGGSRQGLGARAARRTQDGGPWSPEMVPHAPSPSRATLLGAAGPGQAQTQCLWGKEVTGWRCHETPRGIGRPGRWRKTTRSRAREGTFRGQGLPKPSGAKNRRRLAALLYQKRVPQTHLCGVVQWGCNPDSGRQAPRGLWARRPQAVPTLVQLWSQ